MEPEPQPAPLEKQPEDFYNDATQPSMDPEADAETLEFHAEDHALSPVQEDPVTQVYESQPEAEPELASQPVVEASFEAELASQPVVEASLEPELASQPVVEASFEPELASQPVVEASFEAELASQPVVEASFEPELASQPVVEASLEPELASQPIIAASLETPQDTTLDSAWTERHVHRFLGRLCDAAYDLSRDVHDPALWDAVKELVKLPVYERITSVTDIRLMHFRHDRLDPMPHMSPEWRFAFTVGMPIGIRFRTVTEWFDYELWSRWRDEMVSYAGKCFSVN